MRLHYLDQTAWDSEKDVSKFTAHLRSPSRCFTSTFIITMDISSNKTKSPYEPLQFKIYRTARSIVLKWSICGMVCSHIFISKWIIKYLHTYIHPYIHIYIEYIHTYIPRIRKCVTKTIECGRSHKYTSIHNFYSLQYYRHFAKQYYKSSLHVKNSFTE